MRCCLKAKINDPTLKGGVCVMPHPRFSEFSEIVKSPLSRSGRLKFCFRLALRFLNVVPDCVSSYISDGPKEFAA